MWIITYSLLLYGRLILGVTIHTSVEDFKVTTTEGVVVGAKATDGDYVAFYGIPYAGSVSGKQRFKVAPKPVNRNAEFMAVDRGIKCAQPSINGLIGKEDCLTLNIFTKNFTTPKPVIVWLDGEEYSSTNNTPPYSFRSLVQADIVFISLNYRLSIFGFLCLGVEEAPGNAGLKDVVQALTWIQENVVAFGGDPKNVMLLGHGSGAAMVDLMTLSPLSEGLIHKTMSLSGSALSPWTVAYDPAGYAKALGAKLNYMNLTHAELATQLQNTDTNELVNAINQFSFKNNSVLFAPCVENLSLEGSFLRDDPLVLIRSGKYQKIPYVSSYVDMEGTVRVKELVDGEWLKTMQNDFDAFLPANVVFTNESIRNNVSQEIRQGYFGNTANISNLSLRNIQAYFAYEGDILITIPVIRNAQERVAYGSQNVYLLEFTYKGVNYDWPYSNIRLDGVKHGDILDYVFDLESRPVNDSPKKSLIGRIIAYAKTGQPEESTLWFPYNNVTEDYLSIRGNAGGTSENPNPTFDEGMMNKPHVQSVNLFKRVFGDHYAIAHPVTPGDGSENATLVSENSSNLPLILGLLALTVIIVICIIYAIKKTHVLNRFTDILNRREQLDLVPK